MATSPPPDCGTCVVVGEIDRERPLLLIPNSTVTITTIPTVSNCSNCEGRNWHCHHTRPLICPLTRTLYLAQFARSLSTHSTIGSALFPLFLLSNSLSTVTISSITLLNILRGLCATVIATQRGEYVQLHLQWMTSHRLTMSSRAQQLWSVAVVRGINNNSPGRERERALYRVVVVIQQSSHIRIASNWRRLTRVYNCCAET